VGLRPPWGFKIELGFAGLIHGLDDLTEWFQKSLSCSAWFVLDRRADQCDAENVEFGFEHG
jgi:hypothetical protein